MPVLAVDRIYVKTGDCTVWCLDQERGEVVYGRTHHGMTRPAAMDKGCEG